MSENYYNSSLTGENIEATLLGAVRGDVTQNKTAAWKTKARQNIGAADVDSTLAVSGAAADAKAVGEAIYYKSGDTYSNTRDSGKPTNFPGVITGTKAFSFTVVTDKAIPAGMTATVTRLSNVRIYGSNGYVNGSSSVNILNTSGYTVTTAVRGPNLVSVFIDKDTDVAGAVVGSCIVANVSLTLTFN